MDNNTDSLVLDVDEALAIITNYFKKIVSPVMFDLLTKDQEVLKEGALCLLAAMILSEEESEPFDGQPPSQYN